MEVVKQGLVLVSGPSRSGKSRWAERLLAQEHPVTYVATAARRDNDAAWQERLRLHRERRPSHWHLVEAEANLADAVSRIAPDHHLLLDSLGGYVAWCLDCSDDHWGHCSQGLVTALTARQRMTVVVIEETGWGVVPPTAIGGLFRDRLGALAQILERHSQRSWLVVQGRAVDLHALGVLV
ncbi:MAG: bifunctional adenosylcobinamide kinase/adenosylcobinamide-phosphate guanylyltransferase [Synechococcus sp.]